MHKQLNISAPWSGGVITNYYCTSSCRHCLYRCSPKWPKEYITPAAAENNFTAIRNLNCASIHIGGGKPFLQPDALTAVLAAANSSGIHVEYVETNSSWFRDPDNACRILEKMADKGLTTLLVSISPFHNEYIPFAKVRGVMAACRKTGISIFPWSADFIRDLEALLKTKNTLFPNTANVLGRDISTICPSDTGSHRVAEHWRRLAEVVSAKRLPLC